MDGGWEEGGCTYTERKEESGSNRTPVSVVIGHGRYCTSSFSQLHEHCHCRFVWLCLGSLSLLKNSCYRPTAFTPHPDGRDTSFFTLKKLNFPISIFHPKHPKPHQNTSTNDVIGSHAAGSKTTFCLGGNGEGKKGLSTPPTEAVRCSQTIY